MVNFAHDTTWSNTHRISEPRSRKRQAGTAKLDNHGREAVLLLTVALPYCVVRHLRALSHYHLPPEYYPDRSHGHEASRDAEDP